MTTLQEIRYGRYGRREQPEMKPYTAGAEDPETTPEQIAGMVDAVFNLGWERKEELDKFVGERSGALNHYSDGTYHIRYASKGDYSDFTSIANYEYLEKKYPFLHGVSGGLGFDEDDAADDAGSFEDYLAKISQDDWEAFIEDLTTMEDYTSLDDDRASELEMEEAGRWMDEDGGPELIRKMVVTVDDGYEAYQLSKVTLKMVWEWSRETEHYPENAGDGSVYMDVDKLAKERETQEWFLDQIEDDPAGWEAVKRAYYDEKGAVPFDRMLQTLAATDENVTHVVNRMDNDILWRMFLKAFPDAPERDDDPYWYGLRGFGKDDLTTFFPGYKPEESYNETQAARTYAEALNYLSEAPWFVQMIRDWFNRGPEGHPELKFEALEAVSEALDPDDPALYIQHGQGIAENIVYEDDKIVVLEPRDMAALQYHFDRMGWAGVASWDWYRNKEAFVVLGKTEGDLYGHQEKRELGVIVGNGKLVLQHPRMKLEALLKDPTYGSSVRKMLLRFYRKSIERDDSAAPILLQLGGPAELRRADRKGDLDAKYYMLEIALYYVDRHKYGLAAKALGRPISTLKPGGVWLYFDYVDALAPCFRNSDAAETVFASEHYDWFEHDGDTLDVSDVVPYLDKEAIDHIRSVMVNRRVWFPDAGPEGRGDYVILTPKVMKEYDDATMLDWLAHLSDEDSQDGVFDDIIDALKEAGRRMLQQASQDNVYTGFIEAAVRAIDGSEFKYGSHPTKKDKSGNPKDAFMVFVPWTSVKTWAADYMEQQSEPYGVNLEGLAVQMNEGTVDSDADGYHASWRDVTKELAVQFLDPILDLEPPEPEPGMPNYVDPRQMELPIKEALDVDSPEAMPDLFSGVPVELQRQVERILVGLTEPYGIGITDLKTDFSNIRSEPLYSADDAHFIPLDRSEPTTFWKVAVSFRPDVAEELFWEQVSPYALMNKIGNAVDYAYRDRLDPYGQAFETNCEPDHICMRFVLREQEACLTGEVPF